MKPSKKGILVGAGVFSVLLTITVLNVSKSDIPQLLIAQFLFSSIVGVGVWAASRERKTINTDNLNNAGNNILVAQSKDDGTATQTKDINSTFQQVDNEMTPLYKAAIGDKNQNYYLSRFQRYDQQDTGAQVSWNWAAFLIPSYWWLYRKMYGWWALLVAGFVLSIAKPESRILYSLAVTVLTVFSNSLYHRHIRATITEAKSKQLEGDQLLDYLRQKCGVTKWVYILAIFTPVVIVIITFIGWFSPR